MRARFPEFYAALFDQALSEVPNAVVTEYSWDAGSCDPCPGPTLDGNDLATLGADVIDTTYKTGGAAYTLTRLHARYGKDITDDLVFRAVEPIVGGRGIPNAQGELGMKVETTSSNNFQGRYVILHPWTGTVACETPNRGRWGAPPNGQQIATPATNTAFAPRGGAQLATFVDGTPHAGMLSSKGAEVPIPVRQPRSQGCGCEAQGGAASAAGALAVGLLLMRRRRRTC